MKSTTASWDYQHYFAYALIYIAEMHYNISPAELDFIKNHTGLESVAEIDALVKANSDIESMDILQEFKARFLNTPEKENAVRKDLEALFAVEHHHQQFEKAALHLIEKIL